MSTFLIDPGHGGKFVGAVGRLVEQAGKEREVYEKDLNLKASGILKFLLETAGHTVYMTREGDYHLGKDLDEDLHARINIANTIAPRAFISVHCNAAMSPEAHGFEVWTSPGKTRADSLAEKIFEKVEMLGTHMRPELSDGDSDREGRLYVLMKTECPAVLVELGFMTHRDDLANLCRDVYLNEMMSYIAAGVKTWDRTSG